MPTGALRRTFEARLDARYKPGRASSPEITIRSSDEMADGRDRKRGHETLLERRRSLRTDEMATNGGRARTPSPPVSPKEAQKRPNLPIFLLFYLRLRFLEAGALSTVHMLIDGSPRASRIGRAGPRRAPKCARDAPSWNPLERVYPPYMWITSFPTASFCSTQLPSSSAVLGVLWDARGELVMAV